MLISMPTGTSTIFGAFQAILVSLSLGQNRDEPRPAGKFNTDQKLRASKILLAQRRKGIFYCDA
jgi:hypothetical protein